MSAVLSRHLGDLLNPRTPEGPSPKFSPSSKQWPIARCSTSRFLRCCSAGWLACEKHKSGKQTPPRRRATGSLISVERWWNWLWSSLVISHWDQVYITQGAGRGRRRGGKQTEPGWSFGRIRLCIWRWSAPDNRRFRPVFL